jgi:hypothetical protein
MGRARAGGGVRVDEVERGDDQSYTTACLCRSSQHAVPTLPCGMQDAHTFRRSDVSRVSGRCVPCGACTH